ncbi:MAG: hypothetical protein LBM18_03340, partial [Oscillospiraceae bacterium]|nr:hypothetical protein [Oscillospiraceae bacterium]
HSNHSFVIAIICQRLTDVLTPSLTYVLTFFTYRCPETGHGVALRRRDLKAAPVGAALICGNFC